MRLFFLLLLTSMAFAQYAEPPMNTVLNDNVDIAPSLEDRYNSTYAVNTTVNLTFEDYTRSIDVSSSIEILALSPSIDNMSCATNGLAILFARGEELGDLIALPSEGYPDFVCDPDYPTEYAWRCDFDDDTCVEYVEDKWVAYEDLNLTLSFKNMTLEVPFSSTLIVIPQEMLDEMDSASGNDSLSVSFSGNLTFYYHVNNRTSSWDCGSNYSNVTTSVPFNLSRSFRVGGSKKLFFLKSPVLHEQWYRSNSFDVIVLSQCPLYYAEISENGNLSENLTLRMFSISTDNYGISYVVSNSTNTTEEGWSEDASGVADPFQLEYENNSFLFTYQFNHSYSGLGENNLSIIVYDVNSRQAEFNETLLSRALSFNEEHLEAGLPDSVPSRPSIARPEHSLVRLEIALGLITLVLIVAFVNSWLLGKS